IASTERAVMTGGLSSDPVLGDTLVEPQRPPDARPIATRRALPRAVWVAGGVCIAALALAMTATRLRSGHTAAEASPAPPAAGARPPPPPRPAPAAPSARAPPSAPRPAGRSGADARA